MVTIRDVRVISLRAQSPNLTVVKIETSEPGLCGLGCATFTQRHLLVEAAVREYLRPRLVGRDVSRIEELWQLTKHNSYWRNGPVLNNAVSGVDGALWDIRGKLAGMPVYELWGGKCREAADTYGHVSAGDSEELADRVEAALASGRRHLRIQRSGAGRSYGGPVCDGVRPEGALPGHYTDSRAYMRSTLELLEAFRERFGFEVEILHDVHEQLHPAEAVEFARMVEPVRLFFLEDALAPEEIEWFKRIRATCTTRLAMGELFVHRNEWRGLVAENLIDYVRMHVSDIAGPTEARKVAAACELFGVQTAWHGPGDVSPVGHAVNVHLDVSSPAFGIQEFGQIGELLREIFPGAPELRDGYLYPNSAPGWGIELDEELAAKHPAIAEAPPPGHLHPYDIRNADGRLWRY